MMGDMAHDTDHTLGESRGIVRLSVTRGHRRASFHRYAGKWTRPWLPGGLETRGTTGCCIRSKSSRFYLHVFREGNGRTQWVFWSQIAQQASYSIDWRGATGQVNDRASRDAMETQDLTGLKTMFTDIVT